MNAGLVYKSFWMVWNHDGRAPTYRHASLDSAVREAERLAREHAGETFVVLEAVEARRVDDMLRLKLTNDADIPF